MKSVFVHCGQHYDYNMVQQFIENLELPPPDFFLKIKASSPGAQTAEIMANMNQLLEKIDPSIVLVEGDTNSVLATALAANKQTIPIGHVEAGLRSFDRKMPEEIKNKYLKHLLILNFMIISFNKVEAKRLVRNCLNFVFSFAHRA